MSKKTDKMFAEFVLKGVSYDSSADYFVINPHFLEILLQVAEDKRDLYKLKEETRK